MDGEVAASRYWCHRCVQAINPTRIEADIVECPLCHDGFVEDIPPSGLSLGVVENTEDFGHLSDPLVVAGNGGGGEGGGGGGSESESDRALSLWAPILLGMMSNPRRRSRRFRRRIEPEDGDEDADQNPHEEEENEINREIESIIRRRRRYTSTILQILQSIPAGLLAETEDENNRNLSLDLNIMEREVVADSLENSILINPFDHSIIVNGSSFNSNQNQNQNRIGSLGDYFIGPSLDLLLQHLSENDPNRYGTPPAQKEFVEAIPTVRIEESMRCCICLDDFEIGKEAKEMPCKHKFHGECIVPWLKLHSSCPVCRYQLPFEEPKLERDDDMDRSRADASGGGFSLPIQWPPLTSLVSMPNGNNTTSSSSSSGSHSIGPGSESRADHEN